ncbi:hypothetical protein [Clostridium sp.]|uniref:hypothetical protein n=1 Tax=Clostridium sp. TaxID=1506 RepID=UPI002913B305|nr:hypothetical protein [Clostridium sp.]MDU3410091.1 hypothetical protein [Clostridium sp.]
MEKKYITTSFSSNFDKVNDEFVKCTVSVMSESQIANGTKFTKEAIDNALPTLNYAPVIGYYKGDDFSDHGIEYKISNDGFEEIINTIPFGVCIKDSQRFEKIMKENGEYEEYLVVDCYLWSRYADAINKVKENKCNQSMEVNVLNGNWQDTYFEVTDFNYSALCILSESVAPAFSLAKIRTSDKFSKDDFKACYSEMTVALNKFLNFEEGGNELQENEIKDEEIIDEKVEMEEIAEETTEEAQEETVVEETSEEVEDFEEKYNNAMNELNKVKAEFIDLKSDYSTLESEISGLREFKANVEKAEFEAKEKKRKEDIDLALDVYSELKSLEGYEEIMRNRYENATEDTEIKLKALAFDNGVIMKKNKKKSFSKETSFIKTNEVKVNDELTEAEKRYGTSIKKYISNY